jgi:hypothetical protein
VITIQLEDYQEGISLLGDWLRSNPSLGRPKIEAVPPQPDVGEMGAIADTIQVALGSGSILPALAASISTWAVSRRRKMTINVNGHSVRVDGSKDPDKLAQDILEQLTKSNERGN